MHSLSNALARSTTGTIGVLAAALVAASVATAADWPAWRGINRDGISAETGWKTDWSPEGLKEAWKADVGVGLSSMTVSDGKVFTMGNREGTDVVFCLDAATGKTVWEHKYPCSPEDPNGFAGTRVTPTVDGPRVFSVSRQGQLFCLDKATGQPLWSKDYARDFNAPVPKAGANEWWGYAGSPLIEGKLVIFETGGPGAALVACDSATGEVVWKAGDDFVGYSSPMPYTHKGERCVAVFSARFVTGRSLKDGKELWKHPWKTAYNVNASTPVFSDGEVFVSSGYNAGCVLLNVNNDPPTVVWQNKNMRNHVCTCVLWKGYLYGFDESTLKCVDWATGEVKWSQGGLGKGSVFMAGQKLVLYSDSGTPVLAEPSPEAYKELGRGPKLGGKNTWAVPVLSNKRLYCRTGETLYCFEL